MGVGPFDVPSGTVSRVASTDPSGCFGLERAGSGAAPSKEGPSGRTYMASGYSSREKESEEHVVDIPRLLKRSRRGDVVNGASSSRKSRRTRWG